MDEDMINQFSEILKEKNIDLDSILKNVNNSKNNSSSTDLNSSSSSSNPSNNIDIETILKIKEIFDATNNPGSNSNLLMALKPYMRESRKDKIDKYAKMLTLARVFQNFQNLGGEKNNGL